MVSSDSEILNLSSEVQSEDVDRALRPQMLSEFIGQKEVRENLRIFIDSARKRKVALDHTIFHGPPGLGKTTLAQIIARSEEHTSELQSRVDLVNKKNIIFF